MIGMGSKNKTMKSSYNPVKEHESEVFHSSVPVVTFLPEGFALRRLYVDYYEAFRKHAQIQVRQIDGDHFNASYLDAEILAKTEQQLEHLEQQMATKVDLVHRGIERKLIEDRRRLLERISEAEEELSANKQRMAELKTILRKGTIYETISGGAS